MKVLILSQYYPPEFAIIPYGLAQHLSEKGHTVSVLTTFPNYPEGKTYAGYKQRIKQSENASGIEILRVPMFINRSRNPLLRILSYLSFAFSASMHLSFTKNVDVVYVYATQMTPAIAAVFWKKLKRIPFVLHIQDLWPESITGSGLIESRRTNTIISILITNWLNSVYEHARSIIAIAPHMKKMLVDRGVPSNKISMVYNWADDSQQQSKEFISDKFAQMYQELRNKTKFVYSGNMGEVQALDSLITAISLLQEHDRSNCHLFFVGSGNLKATLVRQVENLQLDNVTFIERVPPQEMSDIYLLSDFQIITLKDLNIFTGTIPSKLQGALAHGVPVVTSVNGDVNELVSKNNLGFVSLSENPQSIASALSTAIRSSEEERLILSRNAFNFYDQHMSLANGANQIAQILIGASQQSKQQSGGKIVQ